MTLGRSADLGGDRSPAAMERRCHEMLDAAYGLGVRYFDTARSYGLAEQFLARWLAARNPPDVTVGSKWGYVYVGAWRMDAAVHETKDLSVGTLRRQFGESRALLGDRLSLYQIHSATVESGVLDAAAVIAALTAIRAAGVAIGLSVTGPRQIDTIRKAMTVRADGRDLFQCVQATWNLLEPSSAPALEEAHARGWGVIVKEVMANGRLAASADAALSAALRQPWIDVVLSGAVTREQLAVGAAAVERAPRAAVTASIPAEDPERYWNERRQLPWA